MKISITSDVAQRTAVSALIAANEALIEAGGLPHREQHLLRRIIASVREAFEERAAASPTLILVNFEEV